MIWTGKGRESKGSRGAGRPQEKYVHHDVWAGICLPTLGLTLETPEQTGVFCSTQSFLSYCWEESESIPTLSPATARKETASQRPQTDSSVGKDSLLPQALQSEAQGAAD